MYATEQLTWLMFIQPSQINDIEFFIPYNSQFFVIYPFNPSGFKLTKLHNLGENLIFQDYGIWYGIQNHSFPVIPRYTAGMDANKTTLVGLETFCRIVNN